MDCITGGLHTLYTFALPVHVQSLRICDIDAEDTRMLISAPLMLHTVLDGVRPIMLHYEATNPAIFLNPEFFSALAETRDPPMQALSLGITVNDESRASIETLDAVIVSWKMAWYTTDSDTPTT